MEVSFACIYRFLRGEEWMVPREYWLGDEKALEAE
jgi:hypothetical protein